MIKNTFFMGMTTLVRVLTGSVIFIILARIWGVEQFGMFMFWYSLSTLITLVVEYGFSYQILKEVGREPKSVEFVMKKFLSAKVGLTFFVLSMVFLMTPFITIENDELVIFLYLLLGSIVYSFTDFHNVAFRALGLFNVETGINIFSNIILFSFVSGMAFIGYSPVVVAGTFLLSRVIHLLITLHKYTSLIGRPSVEFRASEIASTVRSGLAYGVDVSVTNLYGNIDTILVKLVLGDAAVGVYQAGMRLVQSVLLFLPVFGNVYLPGLSHKKKSAAEFSELANNLQIKTVGIGLLCGVTFVFFGFDMTLFLYGTEYSQLAEIIPYLGLFIFLRFVVASYGVTLTASGLQVARVWSITISSISLSIFGYVFLQDDGIVGICRALLLSTVILYALFFLVLWARNLPIGRWSTNSLVLSGLVIGTIVII